MKTGPRIPIAAKLVSVTVILTLAVAAPIAFLNSRLFDSELGKAQQDANAELAQSKSSEVEVLTLNLLEKIRTVTNLMLQDFADEGQRERAMDLVFRRDLDLVRIEIYRLDKATPELFKTETNAAYLRDQGLDEKYFTRLRQERPFQIATVFAEPDRIQFRPATLSPDAPLFALGVPFQQKGGLVHHAAVAYVRLDRLQKIFALNGARRLALVDLSGNVLAHTDDQVALESESYARLPIVTEALSKGAKAMQGEKIYTNASTGTRFVGAYSKTAFGPVVIAQVPEEIILEPARLLRRNVFETAGYVLSVALFFVILFALSLTFPIEKLHEATLLIARGNLNVRAKVRSRDEVGSLAMAFNEMVVGLLERDKIKTIFNKFHGSSITEDLLKKGSVNLGGTRKEVTVLFSDIRDFTKFSEGHTPEEVVEMLNEYFQVMVSIITRHHGIVDKFVGDAIMAVWGAPNGTENDRYFALMACLEMRRDLAELNEIRLARGHTPIKIGIGLHSGQAISGTIGSEERMEYTVIGDTVNMASRIESSTKAFGADLLVSQAVVAGLEPHFMFEYVGTAEVKGKSEPIEMFKVRGLIDERGNTVPVQTAYSDYESGHVDKVKVS